MSKRAITDAVAPRHSRNQKKQGHQQRGRRRASLIALAVVATIVVVGLGVVATRGRGSPALTRRPSPAQVQALDPALFSPGACVAFPPTHGNRHVTVFLDAGHGGIDWRYPLALAYLAERLTAAP